MLHFISKTISKSIKSFRLHIVRRIIKMLVKFPSICVNVRLDQLSSVSSSSIHRRNDDKLYEAAMDLRVAQKRSPQGL